MHCRPPKAKHQEPCGPGERRLAASSERSAAKGESDSEDEGSDMSDGESDERRGSTLREARRPLSKASHHGDVL